MNDLILTPDQVAMVAHHAITRRYRRLCGDHRDNKQQNTPFSWDKEIEAAAAEYWYSCLTNKVWTGVRASNQSDVEGDEVRWTGRDHGNLLLYNSDSPSRRYILIGGAAPKFFIVGWAYGAEGMKQEYFRSDMDHYIYPRRLLHSPGELYSKGAAANGSIRDK